MSRKQFSIDLSCCRNVQQVWFDSFEAPYLAEGIYRKSITCDACGSFLIIDCDSTKEFAEFQQEIVNLP